MATTSELIEFTDALAPVVNNHRVVIAHADVLKEPAASCPWVLQHAATLGGGHAVLGRAHERHLELTCGSLRARLHLHLDSAFIPAAAPSCPEHLEAVTLRSREVGEEWLLGQRWNVVHAWADQETEGVAQLGWDLKRTAGLHAVVEAMTAAQVEHLRRPYDGEKRNGRGRVPPTPRGSNLCEVAPHGDNPRRPRRGKMRGRIKASPGVPERVSVLKA
mmetsp:Transcript_87512/g.245761  ORF Transcript_87512/g.245761 Transcript_87512/m.245761 type:complete len:218 (+) Transcript_87512:612-1265(+)